MIMVRDEFQCEPGRVNEFVKRFREMANMLNNQGVIKHASIMTDLSGSFDTVVVESEIESLDAYFAMLHATFANRESSSAEGESNNRFYRSGSRTFYTIEASFAVDG